MMTWCGVRRFLRDLYLHFFWGTICVLSRRHRKLVYVGEIGKKGFRGVPIKQCHRCMTFVVEDRDAIRLGGKIA